MPRPPKLPPLTSPELDRLLQVAWNAQQGDPAALAELRDVLGQSGTWQDLGDLTRVVEEELLKLGCGSDPLASQAIKGKLDDLKKELTEEALPTALGRLLADQVAIDFLRLRVAELETTQEGKVAAGQKRRRLVAHTDYLATLNLFDRVARKIKRAKAGRKRANDSVNNCGVQSS